jgi:hypothetical protein
VNPEPVPGFDIHRSNSFSEMKTPDLLPQSSSKKLERNLMRRASRVELIDHMSNLSEYLTKNVNLNESFKLGSLPF